MAQREPIVVLGSGPAGMATALALIKSGHKVVIYERYREARPAGNILNLWPPPIKALQCMGVDTDDIGAACRTSFHNAAGHKRCDVHIPEKVVQEYGGGFVGLLRPDLYQRMLDVIPEGMIKWNSQVTRIHDHGTHIALDFADGSTVHTPLLIGADGIESIVRRHLWGPQDKRPHNLMLIGGFSFHDDVLDEHNQVAVHHSATVQATWTSILSKGRRGVQWWFVQAWPDDKPAPADLLKHAAKLAVEFPDKIRQILAATSESNVQTWKIRDLPPLKKWSRGRITIAGDAAHATSPYAAYGAGMSICDGYYLGQVLHNVDLDNLEAVERALTQYDRSRIPHTTTQVSMAHFLGQMFHHTPWYLQKARDLFLDWTPFLQWQVGDTNPRQIVEQLDEMGQDILNPKVVAYCCDP